MEAAVPTTVTPTSPAPLSASGSNTTAQAVDYEAANAKDFVSFLTESVTHFHAVAVASRRLEAAGFVRIREAEPWGGDGSATEAVVCPGGKYYFTRNQSTIFAFVVGEQYKPGNGVNVAAAHTDSPNLKVKPHSRASDAGCQQVAIEPYGGGLWHTWFDRDLTVAGRVVVQSGETGFQHRLVHVKRPVLRIPNLAIHLTAAADRSAFSFNTQTQFGFPILATELKAALEQNLKPSSGAHHSVLLKLVADELKVQPDQIKDFELSVVDTHTPCVGGALNEFIFSPRLDNLFMSYCCLMGLINTSNEESLANESRIRLVALFDNEEIGSQSAHGADSNMMPSVIERIAGAMGASGDAIQQTYRQSFIVSADMAHATHPSYSEKHDKLHTIKFHEGVVLKYNGNQRYATTAITAFLIKELAARNGVPLQEFLVRNDSPCGSTIGPILAAKCGVRTIDIGCPQLSMHSIREMAATQDLTHGIRLLTAYFASFTQLDQLLVVD
eukprot:TRINITY_DN8626_c0_g1_i1.p1 TRINITY_DN8626_c0_g1~~TRINITY_DN8626_c0_g1_i1.p1  ORF type:complete len:498 (-),score=80.00 TRINITY_DN8626_c0_g1_i1:199-1692(-)